jgi:hypothetical protein
VRQHYHPRFEVWWQSSVMRRHTEPEIKEAAYHGWFAALGSLREQAFAEKRTEIYDYILEKGYGAMTDREQIVQLEKELKEVKDGYHKLDENWNTIHNVAIDTFRLTLDMPDATIPEMIARIETLKGTHE